MSHHGRTGKAATGWFGTNGPAAKGPAAGSNKETPIQHKVSDGELTRKFTIFLRQLKNQSFPFTLVIKGGGSTRVYGSSSIFEIGKTERDSDWRTISGLDQAIFHYRHSPNYSLIDSNERQLLANLLVLDPVTSQVIACIDGSGRFVIKSPRLLHLWESVDEWYPLD